MPILTHHPLATISWVDLSTPDVEGASSFYRELFGWQIESEDAALGRYLVAEIEGHDVAGMMAQGRELAGAGVPASWTIYMRVEDVDATVEAAEDAGGAVLQAPMAIPDGRIAVLADPTGAVFGLMDAEGGIELWDEPGSVSWCEVMTRDTHTAIAFYEHVFGWKSETSRMAGTEYTLFRIDGTQVAGLLAMPEHVPAEAPAHWMVYFAVDDVDATCEGANRLGGSTLVPVTELSIGRFAVLSDPQGAVLSVFESKGSITP